VGVQGRFSDALLAPAAGDVVLQNETSAAEDDNGGTHLIAISRKLIGCAEEIYVGFGRGELSTGMGVYAIEGKQPNPLALAPKDLEDLKATEKGKFKEKYQLQVFLISDSSELRRVFAEQAFFFNAKAKRDDPSTTWSTALNTGRSFTVKNLLILDPPAAALPVAPSAADATAADQTESGYHEVQAAQRFWATFMEFWLFGLCDHHVISDATERGGAFGKLAALRSERPGVEHIWDGSGKSGQCSSRQSAMPIKELLRGLHGL
jgi:hypothetical protein